MGAHPPRYKENIKTSARPAPRDGRIGGVDSRERTRLRAKFPANPWIGLCVQGLFCTIGAFRLSHIQNA